MPEFLSHTAQDEGTITIRFGTPATADEVIARLLEAIRRTDLCLLSVFGDGDRFYPFEGRDPARASSWRAELCWCANAANPGWHLQIFVRRAERFLDCPDGVRLEFSGRRRNPREEVAG